MERECLYSMLLAVFLVGCGSGGGGEESSDNNNTSNSPGPRTSYAAGVFPTGPSPYTCMPPGVATQSVMQKLNRFWQSGVVACGCDWFLLSAKCYRNGFVEPGTGYGYIYYDAAYLNEIDALSGSTLPADFFMAHEFGHNIQLALNLFRTGKLMELQADCLGGYFVGSQVRQGAVNQSELIRTFNFACSIGDPWWLVGSHGTCAERVAALQQGIDGYNQGRLPGQACP
jgi:hypothetical protein